MELGFPLSDQAFGSQDESIHFWVLNDDLYGHESFTETDFISEDPAFDAKVRVERARDLTEFSTNHPINTMLLILEETHAAIYFTSNEKWSLSEIEILIKIFLNP